jgi:vancomycin resistance protein VanW
LSQSQSFKRLLRRVPYFMDLRIKQLQWNRNITDFRQGIRFAALRQSQPLPCLIKEHKSVLKRTLGQTDPQLQDNKVVNLGISISTIDGVLVKPGETFSLWKLVGNPTARKGYIHGLTISHGEVKVGVGGGLCQLANLIFWLGLHTPLTIAERHHHSYDLFPDDRRTLPFGSGTTIYYNYLDLRLYNPTNQTFRLHLWLSDRFLEGAISSDSALPHTYRIEERNHRFERDGEIWHRKNEIWRLTLDRETGQKLTEELLIRNSSEVRYHVDESLNMG